MSDEYNVKVDEDIYPAKYIPETPIRATVSENVISMGGGMSDDAKQALLEVIQNVAYVNGDGQDYYDALYAALYPPATLLYITAVYTQSGTVYTTDSLDSLKNDLVVTAYYDDSTAAVVTTYTLSGTLTAGTSTITVSYGGKTTSFNVTVTAVKTLSSISAVYTQSGTVYDTDSLDSLKTDLVVTAHYSDSSTATVASADYTLSGSLTAGTSTITVTYSGKTTTFTVTVTQTQASLFGTFYNGYALGKRTTAGDNLPAGASWRNTSTARATTQKPFVNDGYVFTVTDSDKYAIAMYPIINNTPVTQPSGSTAQMVDNEYYQGDTSSPSFEAEKGTNTDYAWISLKKIDNTAFTDTELQRGAENVFTYQIATALENATFEAYPWARVGGSTNPEYVYKNSTTTARARSTTPILNKGYTFSVVDSSKYNIVVYNVDKYNPVEVTMPGTGTPTTAWVGHSNNKSWATSDSSTATYVALSFKKLDGTDFTATELANMYGTVFTAST